jgi:L-ascorbate metabolism protein UlaG (beta-lactamase superfamily)
MRIKWHGHACFEFIDSKYSVIIDPHDGKSIGIKPPISSAGIVLISHDHFDHNAQRIIRNEHAAIINEKGDHNFKGFKVQCFHTFHDDMGGSLRGMNTIHKFKMDGITMCHCGDLGEIPCEEVLKELMNVDIIFVPTGEVFTLPIPKVKEFLGIIKPKITVPMHYRVGGLTMPLKTLDDFLNNVPEDAVLYVGNEVDLTSDDINEFLGLWVFDR